ncbi:TIGR02147 family protein [Chitinispirillales bacterium ANBcel5]|uniref:TIGR02147 family protein n=1 Tax=Cellulosispirillum alkaliphilum TaxID=3039283 RepID=UPI002A4EC9E0|nr:TIGR02147 family protein [Chitinispirillales bacterium ANBcel5]
MEKNVDIYNYTDYRKFLNDYYTENKKKYPYFTLRYIAQKVGFKSASLFSQIIRARTNISPDLAHRFTVFLKLSDAQGDYFKKLVLYNQAKCHNDKKRYFQALTSFRMSKIRHIDSKYFYFYDKWYYSAIREVLYIKPLRLEDYRFLAGLLEPSISPVQAKQALLNLEKWGFIVKNSDGLYYRSDCLSTTTGTNVKSFYINNYQTEVLTLAHKAIDSLSKDCKEFSSLTMSLSDEAYSRFLEELQLFRHKLLSIAEDDKNENRIYQLNFQFFPLTKQIKRSL